MGQASETLPAPGAVFTKRAIAWNSAANAFRTLSAFGLGFIVPPLLIKWIPEKEYSAFILSARFAAFFVILDAGMQITVTRRCAEALSVGNTLMASTTLREALRILRRLVGVGMIALVLVAALFPRIFTDIGDGTMADAQICFALFGLSSLFALALSPYAALLVAGNRTPRFAWFSTVVRVVTAGVVIISAALGSGIVPLTVVYAASSMSIAIAPVFLSARIFPWLRTHRGPPNGNLRREILRQSGLFASITVAQFLLNSLDVVIVGRIDYDLIVSYALCVTVVTGLETLHNGLMQPVLPTLSAKRTASTPEEFEVSVRSWSLLVSGFWAVTCLGLFIVAPVFFRVWVGGVLAKEATPVLRLILVGYFLRYADWTYGVTVISVGLFRKISANPILFALLHLIFTVTLGRQYGAIGVATGTAIAAFVGNFFSAFVNMHMTRFDVPVSARRYFTDTVFIPVLVGLPFGAVALLLTENTLLSDAVLVLLAGIGCVAVASVQARTAPWHALSKIRSIRSGR